MLLIASALVLTLAACAPATNRSRRTGPDRSGCRPSRPRRPAATPALPITAPAEPAGAQTYPLTAKDDLGREVSLAARPARIVSLAPAITEVLFAVGAGPQVVGVTEFCNYPPEAQEGREVVGGFSAESMSVEKIIALKPDLVFAEGAAHAPVTGALQAAGVQVFNFDPKDFAGIYANILAAGALTGNASQAGQVVAGMQARVAKVTAIAANIPLDQRVKVFYEVWDEPLMTAGPATFIGQVVEMAGGLNIFADVQEQYPTISAEAVVARAPQVIVGPSTHVDGLTVEKIAGRPGWASLPAVKEGRVAIVDGDIISRGGPRLADALEAVARAIYPERFK